MNPGLILAASLVAGLVTFAGYMVISSSNKPEDEQSKMQGAALVAILLALAVIIVSAIALGD